MMGPDADGQLGTFAREDFTLLNLSRSSTPSSSDELFAHHQHPLPVNPNPNKKKRLRLKKRGGYSIRQNRSSEESSQVRSRGASFGFGCFGGSNVIYVLLLILLSWSVTLSWLAFSLRNQLATTNANLVTYDKITKDLPVELTKMNQTISSLVARVAELQTQLSHYGKNVTDTTTAAGSTSEVKDKGRRPLSQAKELQKTLTETPITNRQ